MCGGGKRAGILGLGCQNSLSFFNNWSRGQKNLINNPFFKRFLLLLYLGANQDFFFLKLLLRIERKA